MEIDVVPLATPFALTLWLPPLLTMVRLLNRRRIDPAAIRVTPRATPPAKTVSEPPLGTVSLAVPPAKTFSLPWELIVVPLTTPFAATLWLPPLSTMVPPAEPTTSLDPAAVHRPPRATPPAKTVSRPPLGPHRLARRAHPEGVLVAVGIYRRTTPQPPALTILSATAVSDGAACRTDDVHRPRRCDGRAGCVVDSRMLGVAIQRIVLAHARRQRADARRGVAHRKARAGLRLNFGIRWTETDGDAVVPADLFAGM